MLMLVRVLFIVYCSCDGVFFRLCLIRFSRCGRLRLVEFFVMCMVVSD